MLLQLLLVSGLSVEAKKKWSCPGDLEFYECGSMCEQKCGVDPPLICALGCEIDSCQCPPGLWRTDDNRCVKSESECFLTIPTPPCPGQTEWQECPNPCADTCAEPRPKWCKALQKVIDRNPGEICAPADCVCPHGKFRTPDDQCVDKKWCEEALSCPGETRFMECGSMCEGICGQETPMMCALGCVNNVCQCPTGTKRTPDDRCVPSEAQCPKPPAPKCPGETVFMECGSSCEGVCGVKTPEVCPDVCVDNTCQCPFGTLRTPDNRCVKSQDDCGPTIPESCPGETVFMECGSMCEGKCGEPIPEICSLACVTNVCQCPEGTLRTEDDRCVEEQNDCAPPSPEPKCPGETVFMECGSMCEGKCGVETPEICALGCEVNVCQCPAGTLRTKDDRCVKSQDLCEDPMCPGETKFFECGTMCEKKCGQVNLDACNLMCNLNVCQCPTGMYRTADDRCLEKEEDCDQPPAPVCPGDTVFFECGTMCPWKCGEPAPKRCNRRCNVNVCQCPVGMFRTKDDRCVPSQDTCDKPEPVEPVCPGDTKFFECGTMCEQKCGEPLVEKCNKMCNLNVCQCPSGMFRTEDDRCVASQGLCEDSKPVEPVICPGETKFFECGTMCENKCGEEPKLICNKMCNLNVCQCPSGHFRTADDRCVSHQDKCPGQCPGDLVRRPCGTPCQRRCGPFGAIEDPEHCKTLNDLMDLAPGELCTEDVCQCPEGKLRTDDNRCVSICPTPSNPYPTFADFQAACEANEGADCRPMGCGWAASGSPCPVPSKPSSIECNHLDGEKECWKVGCTAKERRKSGKLRCKGSAKKWATQ